MPPNRPTPKRTIPPSTPYLSVRVSPSKTINIPWFTSGVAFDGRHPRTSVPPCAPTDFYAGEASEKTSSSPQPTDVTTNVFDYLNDPGNGLSPSESRIAHAAIMWGSPLKWSPEQRRTNVSLTFEYLNGLDEGERLMTIVQYDDFLSKFCENDQELFVKATTPPGPGPSSGGGQLERLGNFILTPEAKAAIVHGLSDQVDSVEKQVVVKLTAVPTQGIAHGVERRDRDEDIIEIKEDIASIKLALLGDMEAEHSIFVRAMCETNASDLTEVAGVKLDDYELARELARLASLPEHGIESSTFLSLWNGAPPIVQKTYRELALLSPFSYFLKAYQAVSYRKELLAKTNASGDKKLVDAVLALPVSLQAGAFVFYRALKELERRQFRTPADEAYWKLLGGRDVKEQELAFKLLFTSASEFKRIGNRQTHKLPTGATRRQRLFAAIASVVPEELAPKAEQAAEAYLLHKSDDQRVREQDSISKFVSTSRSDADLEKFNKNIHDTLAAMYPIVMGRKP